MAWTYDPSLVSDKDKLRFKIGDTVAADPLFQDEELNALLASEVDITAAAIAALDSLVTQYARLVNVRADDISKEAGLLYTRYKERLDSLLVVTSKTANRTMSGNLGSKCLPVIKLC